MALVNQKKRHSFYLVVMLFFSGFCFVSVSFSQVKKSSPPRWRKGYLDFHQISTGMGNACFIQFPDGSNLLIDAGSINRDYKRQYTPVAVFDSTHSTGSYIAEYIKKCIPNEHPFQLDNVIITHFHDDHVGFPDSSSSWSESRTYRLSGITDLANIIPVKLILDNRWPFYEKTDPVNEEIIRNYQLFITEQLKRKDFKIDSFRLGELNKFLNFRSEKMRSSIELKGIASRGKYLKSDGTIENFLENAQSTNLVTLENNLSAALSIRYGNFSFFTGGDIDNLVFDSVRKIGFAEMISNNLKNISFFVAGHHAMKGALNKAMVTSTQPAYLIIPAWSYGHPDLETIRFLSNNFPALKIISTRLHPQTDLELRKVGLNRKIKTGGHIMIRIKRNRNLPRIYLIGLNKS